MEDPDYDEEWEEMQPYEHCPKCGRDYDDIDFDYQSCSKCGWNESEKRWDKRTIRKPTNADYLSGEADILTGRWNY